MNSTQNHTWTNNADIFQNQAYLLQKIHLYAKRNSISYQRQHQRKQHNNPRYRKDKSLRPQSSPLNASKSSSTSTKSIHQLRKNNRQQQEMQLSIKNRLKYLKTTQERQERVLKIAKQKYQQVNQIRHKSFTQKSILSKEKQSIARQYEKYVQMQSSIVKQSRSLQRNSQSRLIQEKTRKVQQMKKQKLEMQKLIHEKKEINQRQKQQRVKSAHKQATSLRQKMRNFNQAKVQKGIQNHKKVKMDESVRFQQQKKANTSLMKYFESQALKIYDNKIKQQQKLSQLQQHLKLKPKLNLSFNQKQKYRQTYQETINERSFVLGTSRPGFSSLSQQRRALTRLNSTNKQLLTSSSAKNNENQNFYLTNPED